MTITDAELLAMHERDELRLHFVRGQLVVVKWHRRRLKYLCLSPTQHPLSGRWRYNIRVKGASRTVGRNRLVWLIVNRAVPEVGLDVDHADADNQNDLPGNLRLREAGDNRRDNFSADNFREVSEFFDAIAQGAIA